MKEGVPKTSIDEYYNIELIHNSVVYIMIIKEAPSLQEVDAPIAKAIRDYLFDLFEKNPEQKYCLLYNALPVGAGFNKFPQQEARKIYDELVSHTQFSGITVISKSKMIRQFVFWYTHFFKQHYFIRVFATLDEALQWIKKSKKRIMVHNNKNI